MTGETVCFLPASSGLPSSHVVCSSSGNREKHEKPKYTAVSLNGFNACCFAMKWMEKISLKKLLLPFGGIRSGFSLAFSKKFHLQGAEQSFLHKSFGVCLFSSGFLAASDIQITCSTTGGPPLMASNWICKGCTY